MTLNGAQITKRNAIEYELEVITGLGQFRAGHGAIVTDWYSSLEEVLAEYTRLLLEAESHQYIVR